MRNSELRELLEKNLYDKIDEFIDEHTQRVHKKNKAKLMEGILQTIEELDETIKSCRIDIKDLKNEGLDHKSLMYEEYISGLIFAKEVLKHNIGGTKEEINQYFEDDE